MKIFIDLHIVSSLIAIVCIAAMITIWARFFLSLIGFLIVLGLSLTLVAVSQSDLQAGHIQAIFLIGVILTFLVVTVFALLRSRGRRQPNRYAKRDRAQSPQVLRFVDRDDEAVVRLARHRVPAPVEDDRELLFEDDRFFEDDADLDEEDPPVRQNRRSTVRSTPRKVAQKSRSQNSRYVVNQVQCRRVGRQVR